MITTPHTNGNGNGHAVKASPAAPPALPLHDQVKLAYFLVLVGTEALGAFSAKVEECREAWKRILPTDTKGAIKVDWKKKEEMPRAFGPYQDWSDFLHHKLQVGRATLDDFNAQIDRINDELRAADRNAKLIERWEFPTVEAKLAQLTERLDRLERGLGGVEK